jgi:hypothetical protein
MDVGEEVIEANNNDIEHEIPQNEEEREDED